ncbi:putative DNA-3-methyladenine glycosylase II [Helianthus debilis subsp. tardiflorus]
MEQPHPQPPLNQQPSPPHPQPPPPPPPEEQPSLTSSISQLTPSNPSKIPIRPQKIRKLSSPPTITTTTVQLKPQSTTIAEADASAIVISTTTTTPTPTTATKNRRRNPSRSPLNIPKVIKPLSTPGEISAAINHLRSADPLLADIIDNHPPPSFDSNQPPFLALTKSILYQQLAYKADELVVKMDDRSLFTMLSMVKGIGSWSVHMFMIFSLHRPDVLPVSDLGVRKGVQLLNMLDELPRPSQMEELCGKWRPYRSVGAWYMWRFVEGKGGAGNGAGAAGLGSNGIVGQQRVGPSEQAQTQQQQQQQQQLQLQLLEPINSIGNLGACIWG